MPQPRTTPPRTRRVTHDPVARDLITKAVAARELPVGDEFFVLSVLSLPIQDHAGDIVRPDGLTYKAHRRNPYIDFEHGLHPDVGRQPVGWARKSLSRPSAEYCQFSAELDVPSVGKCVVPVGGTYFDKDDALQRQVCAGVRDGAWTAVSLEFIPDYTLAKSLGKSPLERRDAYDFRAADVVRWTHCVRPVCPGAQTVLKSLPPELDALGKILRDKQIRGESLHPVILKSLGRYQPRVLVPVHVETKAMTPQDDPGTVYDPTVPDDATGNGMEQGEGGPALNGVSALYSHAQALMAAAQQLEQDMQASDSPELRTMGQQLMQQVQAIAQQAKGVADKHDAKLNGSEMPDMTGDDDTDPDDSELDEGDGTDTEGDDESGDEAAGKKKPPFGKKKAFAPDMTLDANGVLTGVRDVYAAVLKAIQPPKYTLKEVLKGAERVAKPVAAVAPVPAPVVIEPTEPGNGPEDIAAEEKAMRRFLRKKRQLS